MHFNKCDGRRRSSKLILIYHDQEGIGHGCNGEEEACQRFVCSAARVWLTTEGLLRRRKRKKHIDINHAKEGISHKPAGQGRTKGWEVEDGQNIGRGIRTLSSLSFKTRAERVGIRRMGAHHGPQARWLAGLEDGTCRQGICTSL
jgi:hypothetical protein